MRRHRWLALLGVVLLLAVAVAMIIWRGPDWHTVHRSFTRVSWPWVAAAIGLNLLSVVARSVAWDAVIEQSVEPPRPRFRLVFSAFCVGLFANAVLPGRVGEFARCGVLRRHMPGRKGTTATLIGSVFAHRMFDLFPTIVLVVWVLFTAKIPHSIYVAIAVALAVGIALFVMALLLARRQHRELESLGRIAQLVARIRLGLAVMRRPLPALKATTFQFLGWTCQLFAVWAAMRAFNIDLPLPAAGLVLVVMNVATIVTFWPGNVGAVQVLIATALLPYNVEYGHSIAFGIGLQAIEASVGIGVGFIFLAREGLSYATLRQIEEPVEETFDELEKQELGHVRSGVAH
jgi:uncharacterized protein (TIRG00374 family)